MGNQLHDEHAAPARMEDALDFLRLDEIARLADLASSYWRSITLAAGRGETLTVATHYKQVIAVTREVCALVGTLGASEDASP
jgi:hypothetical protein